MMASAAPLLSTRATREPYDLDWVEIGEEAVELLRTYVRFPTVNDPQALAQSAAYETPWLAGREAEAVVWLRDQFESTGVRAELLESAPGRVNLVARLPGSGAGRPIILLSHSDVVPALRKEWSNGIDPFGGEVHDGFVYGRGTLDLKGLGIIHLLTLRLLQRVAPSIRRDVVALILADEEAGGRFGAEWLLGQRPELGNPAVVLGEGAYSVDGMVSGGRPIHAIAVGEKGYLELELVATDAAHHTSMPARHSAPSRLVHALERVLGMKHPVRITALSRQLLEQLGRGAGPLHRWLFAHPRLMTYVARRHTSHSEILTAMLQDTVALTVLAAGQKHNVVPGHARAVLSIRYLPDTVPEDLLHQVQCAVADPAVHVKLLMRKPATVSPFSGKAFEILQKHAAAQATGSVLPIVSPGASDSRFWRTRGVCCYGWLPFLIPAGDLHSVHGPDERVSISAFRSGLRSYVEAVLELTSTGDAELAAS